MPYLSVSNFWKYQNADVWKKSKTHPPWFKHYVHRDREMDALPLAARLLWTELLATATRYSNIIEADLNWLYAETRVPPSVIAEMLPLLVKGGWVSQTMTPRRSRQLSRKNLDDPRDQEVDVDKDGEQEQEVGSQALVQKAEPLPGPLEPLPITKTLEDRNQGDPVIALLRALPDADHGTERVLRSFKLAENAYREALEEVQAKGGGTGFAVAILKRIRDQPPAAGDTFRPYDPPKDPATIIRTMIANGAVPDIETLEAEMRAVGLNGDTATEFRALVTANTSSRDAWLDTVDPPPDPPDEHQGDPE